MFPYDPHALGDDNRSKASTIFKRPFSNACHAIRNSDRSKLKAISERPISYACHVIWNSNRGNRTTPESVITNTCYLI